jgi:hypothetical protein
MNQMYSQTALDERANAVVAPRVYAVWVGGEGVAWHLQCETGVAGELLR